MSVRRGFARRSCWGGIFALSALVFVPLSAQAQSFQPLGFLLGTDHVGATDPKISADGSIIVGSNCCVFAENSTAFRAPFNRNTNMPGAPVAINHVPLNDTSGQPTWSFAAGVSDPTTGPAVIVGSASVHQGPLFRGFQTNQAFRWTQAGGMNGIGFLPGPGVNGAGSSAEAVNAGVKNSVAGGIFIVGSSDTNTPTAFRWTGGRMTRLGFLPGDVASIAYGISANGAVVVGGSCNGLAPTATCHPFRWTQATGMVNLGFLPGAFMSAGYGVSADGNVVVGPACNITNTFVTCRAFRWTASTKMTALGPGIAHDLNAKGDVVVGSITNNQGEEIDAFVWTITGQQSLTKILTSHGVNLSGWQLTGATGVSADGTVIVGRGIRNGRSQNWVVHLPAASSSYDLTLSSSPANGGTVSGAGIFPKNSSRTVKATPNPGFSFVDWEENGVNLGKPATYTFTLTKNLRLTALFKPGRFTISVSERPAAGGTVSGGGTFDGGTKHSVVAHPASGYVFEDWTENGTVVGTAARYTFTVTKDRSLVAHFKKVVTITVSVDSNGGGAVSGAGTFDAGAQRTVFATPESNYSFINWTENGAPVSTNANYTFIASANRNLVAHFLRNAFIILHADPADGGTVSGTGSFPPNTQRVVVATPSPGWSLDHWTRLQSDVDIQVSTDPSYEFTVSPNTTYNLTAHFTPNTYTVTIGIRRGTGEVLVNGTHSRNPVVLTASAAEEIGLNAAEDGGQYFCGWYNADGALVTQNRAYFFKPVADVTLLADFVPNNVALPCDWMTGDRK